MYYLFWAEQKKVDREEQKKKIDTVNKIDGDKFFSLSSHFLFGVKFTIIKCTK